MILLAAFLVSVGVAWALGAPIGRLADVTFRGEVLVFAALILQIILFTPLGDSVPAGVVPPAHLASYLALCVFLALNLRRPGIWLIAFGALSNTLVISVNGGVMPVTLAAWKASGRAARLLEHSHHYHNIVLASAHTHLGFLGDIFPLPAAIPFAEAISIGDILIVLGMTAFVYRSCVRSTRRPHSQVFSPLRVAAYRHVLAGRLCSSLGDWIAMVAVVTWVYDHQHSTIAVSVFLLARILAATIGATVSAPFLDRIQGFRALTAVEASRGLLSVAILTAAVAGAAPAVIALVCLSSLLGAATNPSARSLIPEVLPPNQVHAGNALHGVARNITMVVGTALAAFSVTQLGITAALLIDTASFAAAAALYYRFRNLTSPSQPSPQAIQSRRALLTWLITNRVGFSLTASFAVVTAGIGLYNTTLPAYLTHRLADPNTYGYALATIGAGLMVGELLTAFISRETLVRRSIPIAFTASAAVMFAFAASDAKTTAYLMLFLLGASDGVTEVVYDTLMQRAAPPAIRAGVFAIASSINNLGMAVGFAAAALLATTVSPHTAVVIAGGTCLLGAPLALPLLVRRIRPTPRASLARHRPDPLLADQSRTLRTAYHPAEPESPTTPLPRFINMANLPPLTQPDTTLDAALEQTRLTLSRLETFATDQVEQHKTVLREHANHIDTAYTDALDAPRKIMDDALAEAHLQAEAIVHESTRITAEFQSRLHHQLAALSQAVNHDAAKLDAAIHRDPANITRQAKKLTDQARTKLDEAQRQVSATLNATQTILAPTATPGLSDPLCRHDRKGASCLRGQDRERVDGGDRRGR